MDLHQLHQLEVSALAALAPVTTIAELNLVREQYLAKKGPLFALMGELKTLPPEAKATFGKALNDLKLTLMAAFDERQAVLAEAELNKRLISEQIDITLPGTNLAAGAQNPFYLIQDEMCRIFLGLGYQVVEGPEVESDHFNFELLNIPQDHPARDMQDTFYIDEKTLLRTHTSPVQARVMQASQGRPIRVVCPGKVYRRDDDDATHSHQFGQIEGLLVDKGINLGHLHATLSVFAKAMFGEKREIRFRSSYFPFTEPSVEIDVSCASCGGKGCGMCKGSGWIEVLGGGMVHPNVLKLNGYDPEIMSGFAFGIGLERVALLRYDIDDIRKIYQNDLRFLTQFAKR